jgi:TonB family protein
MERVETPDADGSDLPDADSASMSLGEDIPSQEASEASPIPGDALGGDSGIQALEDEEMDAIRGESPVSEIEERRIRMANEYLARMKRQIVTAWDQPDTANARHKGEIRFSVDSRGYLRTSRVHLPSGHEPLDESALRAVRAVERYRVPDSPSIVREYYQSLRFTYSGAPVNNDQ